MATAADEVVARALAFLPEQTDPEGPGDVLTYESIGGDSLGSRAWEIIARDYRTAGRSDQDPGIAIWVGRIVYIAASGQLPPDLAISEQQKVWRNALGGTAIQWT